MESIGFVNINVECNDMAFVYDDEVIMKSESFLIFIV